MKKKIIITATIFVIIFILLFIYNFYSMETRNAVEELINNKKMINVLIAGSNAYNDNKHKFFAIVSINPDNSRVGITFIPPAYRIKLDDKGSKVIRIDEIDFSNFKKIKSTFYDDLKLHVPFYIELYSTDIGRIINLINGIDLFVLDQIKEMNNIDFGINYFDDVKMIRYINSVEQNSIYLKFDRIQDILLTLYYNRKELKKFCNIEFITEMFKSIKTNLLPQEILKIGEIVQGNGNLLCVMLPGGFEGNYYLIDDDTYKVYKKDFLTQLVIEKEIEPSIKIKILNGTDVPGLARKIRNNLIRDGLNVVEFGTSPYRRMKNSIIISRKGNYSAVNKVSELTGIKNIYHIIDTTQLYNVLIILGEDLTK